MKKRLLALALCLVMMTSLLPVTALADAQTPIFSGLEQGNNYCGEVQFSVSVEGDVGTVTVDYRTYPYYDSNIIPADGDGKYTLPGGIGSVRVEAINRIGSTNHTNSIHVTVNNGQHTWTGGTPVGNGKHSHSCSNCPATKTEDCTDTNANCECDTCGATMHTWQFKASGNTLTGTCGSCKKEVSVTLKADSVTLPNSPFNARLEGLEQFKKEVPSAVIGDFVYKYKGSGDSEYRVVTPTAANAKAGEYQVGVRISGLPNKEYGPVEMSLDDEVIPDGAGYADLYVKYTAVDPAVTAQTGDNRPIELMMASVLVFSALAAAAFIADSKRRSHQ